MSKRQAQGELRVAERDSAIYQLTKLQMMDANSADIDLVQAILSSFVPQNASEIEIYSKVALRFNLSIDLGKITQFLPEIITSKLTAQEFGDYLKAFCTCGFYKEQLGPSIEAMRAKSLILLKQEFTRRNPNANLAIALLIHAKNLGILDQASEQEKNDLRETLLLLPQFNMSDTAYSSLLEVALYAKEVLKINLPQNLVDYCQVREAEVMDDKTSEVHLKIFKRLANYLASKGFQNNPKPHKDMKAAREYHCGDLSIIVEADYGKLSEDGKTIKKTDILLVLKRPNGLPDMVLSIEVDGKNHITKINGQEFVNGQTQSRNNLQREVFGPGNLLAIFTQDFYKFENQENANEFFKSCSQIQNLIWVMEQDIEAALSKVAAVEPAPVSAAPLAKEEETSKVVEEEPEAKPTPARVSKVQKERNKRDEEALRQLMILREQEMANLTQNTQAYLLNLVKSKEIDLEKIEEILREEKSKLSIEDAKKMMRELLTEVAGSKHENIELFLLLVANCTKEEKENLLPNVKTKHPLLKNIIERSKKDPRIDLQRDLPFSKSPHSVHDDLRKLIERGPMVFVHDTVSMSQCTSRWQLEYMFLHRSYDSLPRAARSLLLKGAASFNNFNLIKMMIEKSLITPEMKADKTLAAEIMGYAILFNNVEMLQSLTENGFDFKNLMLSTISSLAPQYALSIAVVMPDGLAMVKYLVEKLGYDVNSKHPVQLEGDNVFTVSSVRQYVTRSNNFELAKYFVERGMNWKSVDDSRLLSAVMVAIINNSVQFAKYLIDKFGVDVFGRTPEEHRQQYRESEQDKYLEHLQMIFARIITENYTDMFNYLVDEYMPQHFDEKSIKSIFMFIYNQKDAQKKPIFYFEDNKIYLMYAMVRNGNMPMLETVLEHLTSSESKRKEIVLFLLAGKANQYQDKKADNIPVVESAVKDANPQMLKCALELTEKYGDIKSCDFVKLGEEAKKIPDREKQQAVRKVLVEMQVKIKKKEKEANTTAASEAVVPKESTQLVPGQKLGKS